MNIVDSSGWLEYFADGPNADFFAPVIQAASELLVPSISLYEVSKKILQQKTEDDALRAVALMMRGLVVDLTSPIAIRAAMVSLKLRMPMADSIILATAQAHEATLWTQDADFQNIAGVRYIRAGSPP